MPSKAGPDGLAVPVHVVLADLAVLDLESLQWKQGGNGLFRRCSHSAVALPASNHAADGKAYHDQWELQAICCAF